MYNLPLSFSIGTASRQLLMRKIQNYLPAHALLPTSRLDELLMQARDYQLSKLNTFGFSNSTFSVQFREEDRNSHLLQNLSSYNKRAEIPSRCIQTLRFGYKVATYM